MKNKKPKLIESNKKVVLPLWISLFNCCPKKLGLPFCRSGNPCNVNYMGLYNEWVNAKFQWFTWAVFPVMTSSPLKTTKTVQWCLKTGNPAQVNFSRSYYDLQSESNSIS